MNARTSSQKRPAERVSAGKDIRARMDALGISMAELAWQAGVSASVVDRAIYGFCAREAAMIRIRYALNTLEIRREREMRSKEPPMAPKICPTCDLEYLMANIDTDNYFSKKLLCPHCKAVVGELK